MMKVNCITMLGDVTSVEMKPKSKVSEMISTLATKLDMKPDEFFLTIGKQQIPENDQRLLTELGARSGEADTLRFYLMFKCKTIDDGTKNGMLVNAAMLRKVGAPEILKQRDLRRKVDAAFASEGVKGLYVNTVFYPSNPDKAEQVRARVLAEESSSDVQPRRSVFS